VASFLQSVIVKESAFRLYAMTDSKKLKIIVINSFVASEGADEIEQVRVERVRTLCIRLLADGYNILMALARFKVDQKLRDALSEATMKLAEHKLIARAKGFLMERHHCTRTTRIASGGG
jgi:AmiR/NasT family two-component response regulator